MSESAIVPFAPGGEPARSIVSDDMVVFGQTYGRPQDNPARMYLLDLAEGSRPALEAALNTVANALLPGVTLDDIVWHTLTLQALQTGTRAEHMQGCPSV